MFRPLLACIPCVFCALAVAQPLTTSFTFQGQLKTAGTPAAGLYDARFRLYDSPTGGTQLGPTLCSDNLTLTNGTFTTQLDFGAQFTGQQRFLEVDVRQDTGLNCSNSTGFTTLTPRQPLSAAPNAIYSLNASTAASATNATQLNGQSAAFYQNAANLSGALPSASLAGAYSSTLNLTNVNNLFNGSFTGSGAALAGLNASNLASGTLDAARLPLPLTLTGSGATHIIRAENTSTASNAAGLLGLATGASGHTLGVYGSSSSPSGSGVYGLANAASGSNFGGSFENFSTGGGGLYGLAHSSTGIVSGVQGVCNSQNGFGVYGRSDAGAGASYGGYFENFSTSGTGVYGVTYAITGATYGGYFQNASTSGRGVYAAATANTGDTWSVFAQNSSTSGTGIYAVATATSGFTHGGHFRSDSTSGQGVYASANAASGTNYGLFAESNSTAGRGVYAVANAASGTTYGLWAQGSSPAGFAGYFQGPGADVVFINNTASGRGMHVVSPGDTAVWAESTGGLAGVHGASNNVNGYGVLGANGGTTGNSYGVVGQTGSAAGWGVFAFGRSGATGVKSFRIDHPDDPAHKYLFHYSTESPEALNSYRGTVTLNQQGEATIDLPPYFAKINKDPSYQLTAVGAPMPLLHVATKISPAALAQGEKAGPSEHAPLCSFTIAGGAPNAEVCWRVEAQRNDRWMQAHGAPVEVRKEGPEDGTYQHPDLYGEPGEKGVLDRAVRSTSPE